MEAIYLTTLITANIFYTLKVIFAHKNKNTDAVYGWCCAEILALCLLLIEIERVTK